MIRAAQFLIPLIASGLGLASPVQRRVDFVRDIQPIFQASCYSCHGAQTQSSNLRLDNREAAFRGGLSGVVIIPGRAQESRLFRRVAGLGDEVPMPLKGERLTPDQVELIRVWIDQGAEWPEAARPSVAQTKKHWAYTKPTRPEIPQVRNAAWVRNPIDSFVLARLEREGLQPSPAASKEALIRRVSLDLIGLPPTLQEIDAFLADTSPDAYEKLADRLLSSPRYGERWARPWLDVARYADTNGYEKDNRRSMWLFRDWVIEALNRDLPFDQFTIQQIAGDLLPNASVEQRIATGFHRNTMINEEGGVDPEEYRVAAVIDRVDTTATVWLGTTLACAQCHNHKYDPFSQEEYYRFFAFFNNTEGEVGTSAGNERESRGSNLTIPPHGVLAAHRKQVEDHIASLEALHSATTPELAAAQEKWEEEARGLMVPWKTLDLSIAASAAGASLSRLQDGSILAGGKAPERDTYILSADTDETPVTAIRLEALSHRSLPNGGPGRSSNGSFSLTGIEVEVAPSRSPGSRQTLRFSDVVAQSGSNIKAAVDADVATGWSVRPGSAGTALDTQAVFVVERPFGFPGGTRITIRLRHESTSPQQVLGRFRIGLTADKDPAKSVRIPIGIQPILELPAVERSQEQSEELRAYYRTIAPSLVSLRERLTQLRILWNDLASPSAMVMKELPEPRKTHVHIRGSFLNKGKEVAPGVPAALHPFPSDAALNRLGLARWLVDPENPLTARVIINRYWMQHFSRGLVETPEDFGSQGQPPAHPELLDWLATEFVRQKWSMKAMHRLMVTSATYRQSARITRAALERDPANKLYARAPRIRLEAELVRDNALAIAGLLSSKMGGPSVFPPQPEGIWNLVYNDDKWRISEGEDRYRRGIYTFWRRTAPYPMFSTFDAPSREAICIRRVSTNTPLQALTTLNDPAFFDAARGLARRIVIETRVEPREAVAYAFRVCTARMPGPRELERLVGLFEKELEHFRNNPQAAQAVAMGGDVDPSRDAEIARFAAWTVVANVLLNLDETLTRG